MDSVQNDEYELVPKNQIEALRQEIERLKRNPFGEIKNSKDILSGMDQLNRNLAKLIAIFETANEEIVRDYKDGANTERLNRVLDQNEKLAKGIVTIADLLAQRKQEDTQWQPAAPEQNPFLSLPPAPSQMRKLPPLDLSGVPPPPR